MSTSPLTSSIITTNGVVIVTQVFPMEASDKVPNCTSGSKDSFGKQPGPPVSKVTEMTRIFLRCQTKSLGIVQIMVGLVCMALGAIIIFSGLFRGETPLVLGAMCVLSGSFSVAAHRGTCIGLMKVCLAVNILSFLVAMGGVVLFCFELSIRPGDLGCVDSISGSWNCIWMASKLNSAVDGFKGVLLVLAVLEACVALTVSIFSIKALLHRESALKTVMVFESEDTRTASDASLCDSNVALLDNGEGPVESLP